MQESSEMVEVPVLVHGGCGDLQRIHSDEGVC
jgi:hypothetical protein